MMNFLRKSLSLEIENFVSLFKNGYKSRFSKSAFVQARMKVKPEVFDKLSHVLLNEFYTDNDAAIKLWRGFRLLAVDGSRITLPITDELIRIYGKTQNQFDTFIIQARCSIIFDVLNNYVLDGALGAIKVGERDLALPHLEHCKNKDLILYDRGYPSYDFVYQHIQKGLDYLIRTKIGFSNAIMNFEKCGEKSQVIEIYPSKNDKLLY